MEEIGEFPWTTIFFSNPLFSCFITIYSLFLLYFPHDYLRVILSPVPLLAGAFLISLLRFGSTRESKTRPGSHENRGDGRRNLEEREEPKVSDSESESETGLDSVNLVKWKLGGPLLEAFKPEFDSELDSDLPVMGGSVSSEEVKEESLIEIDISS
ncbi:unnamed protein product [Arabis nemorensis]|uniref:Uncharacterized protein n=1 Tax=Arabis nemorensis TaxID=586526 RepID=A0A565C2K1_9BRAS|nr:unnamed protein product [Arabis nemorensis]